jgi:peptidoglycan hydrolase-like protein with peptidoglycan-binding domain
MVDDMSRWTSSSSSDVTWRRKQMSANNDIEGVGRDEKAERLLARLEAAGLSVEKRRQALRSYFSKKTR